MNTNIFLCFLCALLVISAVATEPFKDETQAEEPKTQPEFYYRGHGGGGYGGGHGGGWGHGGGHGGGWGHGGGHGGGWGHGGGGHGGWGHGGGGHGGWGHGGGHVDFDEVENRN